ncbi:SusC/RagA family TonB-linked outer membrane protein [Pedobacter agri]|uniref:SusC/RagA family TonB-linked outer membrane protein n=1 Tax=Pedobacter agri TaxID=454586 RepID=UPI002931056E|nr:SusC/RagA family TonB-linked outer membrane protein [Pedobacter agri]
MKKLNYHLATHFILVVIALCLFPLVGLSQQLNSQKISGRITDDTNQPIVGATIILKGTKIGAISNSDGYYSINVPTSISPVVLVYSFVSYLTKEITLGESKTVNIVLLAEQSELNEIIITGYSTQKREAITGSITQISGKKLNDATSPNVSSLLQGKVPGVSVVNSSGRPGAAPTVRIRGRVSLNSTLDPLYVVDGVIQHGAPNLNPTDIETLSVLKDASASSLYGSRGANGVIVITTKTAKPNSSELTISAKAGVSTFNMGNFKLLDAQGLVDLYTGFSNQGAIPASYTPAVAQTNTDWVKIGSQTAPSQEYDLSYLGSSEKAKIYAGGTYFKEEGTVKGYNYERYSGRLNVDYKISKRITFSPKISATYTATESREHSLYDMYRNMPWDSPYDQNGAIVNPQINGTKWFGRDLNNYLYNLQWNFSENKVANAMINGDLNYQISEDFSFRSTNNLTYYHGDGNSYVDPRSTNGSADQGRLSNSTSKRVTRFTNQMLNYNKKIGNHSFSALMAYEYSDYKYNDLSATGKGIVPGTSVINATSSPTTIAGITNDYAFQSLLFSGTYDFSDKYFAQLSFRRDGSSRFGKENKYGNFFSIGGAWNIHREGFFNAKAIDYLRIKAAYGGVGNTPTALYPQYSLYSLSAQYNGLPTAFPSQLGNDNLTWEQTYDFNAGVELGIWKRLNLSIEVYQKRTSNLLSSVPLAAVSGYNSIFDNIGSISNRGIEFTLGAGLVKAENGFNWDLEFNIGKNVNQVKKLYGDKDQVNGNYLYRPGFDISTFYMKKWAGVNPSTGAPQWETINAQTGEVGLTGNYNLAPLQIVGKGTPDFFGGLNSTMSFRGISLRATFAFSEGGLIYNSGRETFDADGAYPTYNQMELKSGWSRWSPTNTDATHPLAFYGGTNNSNKVSSRYLETASFFRMRNLTLGYAFPKLITDKLKLKGVQLFGSVDNPLTLTGFSGLDPETVEYALPKKYLFGINVTL